MLKTNMEFRKGILFIRIKGDLCKETVKGIIDSDFKYIVLNIDDIYSIDSYSIKYLNKIYKSFESKSGKMVICDKFNISQKDPIEIYTEGSSIILKKFEPNCVFCGNTKNLINYRDKLVCKKCAEKIAGLKE